MGLWTSRGTAVFPTCEMDTDRVKGSMGFRGCLRFSPPVKWVQLGAKGLRARGIRLWSRARGVSTGVGAGLDGLGPPVVLCAATLWEILSGENQAHPCGIFTTHA